jgi:hypothetical protein
MPMLHRTQLHEKVTTVRLEVEQVVLRALAKDPKARFASVDEFASALANASHEAVPVKLSPRSMSGTQGDREQPEPQSLSCPSTCWARSSSSPVTHLVAGCAGL